MFRFIFLITFILTAFPGLSLANRGIQDSPALREVLTAISSAYSQGPNFNGFYSSDDFSLIVVGSRTPSYSLVNKENIISHFHSLIKTASEWGSTEEQAIFEDKKVRATYELESLLGDQKFKHYSNTGQYGSEYRTDNYYIGTDFQIWFEETWAD